MCALQQDGRSPLHVAAAAGFDVILAELLDRRSKAAGLQDTVSATSASAVRRVLPRSC
jgi:hypothetical protein